jgi:hypothetical protein
MQMIKGKLLAATIISGLAVSSVGLPASTAGSASAAPAPCAYNSRQHACIPFTSQQLAQLQQLRQEISHLPQQQQFQVYMDALHTVRSDMRNGTLSPAALLAALSDAYNSVTGSSSGGGSGVSNS